MSEWPKVVYKYVHGDEDEDRTVAESLGLTEDSQYNYRPCYEVKFTIEVYENGETYATHIDDIELSEKIRV
jgi:hypothetical protein